MLNGLKQKAARFIAQSVRSGNNSRRVDYAYIGNGIGLARTHAGHKMYVSTKDTGLAPHLIMDGIWERHVEVAIQSVVRVGQTVVEVGSNVGYHTLATCTSIGSTGKLYAFEANPTMYKLLVATIELNGFQNFSKAYELAAADHSGIVRFQFSPESVGGGNIVVGEPDQPNVIVVKAEPLDKVLSDVPSIDLLRMDAEGSEPLVIAGAEQLLSRSPNHKIMMEWSIGMMSSRCDLEAFVVSLKALGHKSWIINAFGGFDPIEIDQLLTIPHCDVLLARTI